MAIISFCLIFLFLIASSSIKGIVAAEVFPYLLKLLRIFSEEIDWLVLHQANKRILDSVGDRLKIPGEKILSNLEKYGNTSAATIPLVMDEAIRNNRIKQNDIIATSGFGAGLSWGAALIKWG